MATCDPQILLNSANCFDCLSDLQLEQVQVQMLCDLVNVGLAGGPFVRISGDTMTGNLGIKIAPTSELHVSGQVTLESTLPATGNNYLLLMQRLVTGNNINQDNVRDLSTVTPSNISAAFCSFDSSVVMNGSQANAHLAGYQDRLVYQGSGSLASLWGFYSGPSHSGAGTLVDRYGMIIHDIGGAGTVTNNYGIYIDDLTRGTTKNYSVYSAGGKSYFAGRMGIGAENSVIALTIGAAGVADASVSLERPVSTQQSYIGMKTVGALSGTNPFWSFGLLASSIDFTIQNYDGVSLLRPFFIKQSNGDIGLGTLVPKSHLDIVGNLTVGVTYGGANAAPTSGAIIEGRVGIGTNAPNANALLDLVSTTLGFKLPTMTTAQKNAIANTAGLMVFDTDLGKACVNSGAGWQTITSA